MVFNDSEGLGIRRPRFGWSLKRIIIVGLIVILAASILLGSQSFTTIPAGTRGVLLTWGQVTGILGEGLHFIIPFSQKVVLMDVTIQKAETSESTASKDLQEVTTTIAVNYRLNPSFVDAIYIDLRQDYELRVIKPNIEESIKAATALFEAEELVTKRAQVKLEFENTLKDRLQDYQLDILGVSITDFQFSEEFADAVEAKVTAAQRALEAQNKLEQIRYEAQQQIIQAEAAANATVATATAEAQKVIIAAEAQAEAIQLIQEQISQNPEYLQYLSILQWNGVLPYFFGGDVIPFIEVPTNSTSNP
jgi:regulator of protease activity HflC (stomatin/prohibitin superfamily)